ncbi:MAG: tRNA guanosine(34) transglycosylase Tgt [Bacteroidetes bacterium]|nr:tRNA guanosine(34) transglycosylase Tgt [Bacteroidota bacterium]MBU2636952.1 tRNA guanosine(34) transglycosylase Tgt [Bacteroidota bacterium]
MKFSVQNTDGKARSGILETDHGIIETPVFIPVGTQGSVKAIEQRELEEIGAQIILGNTYHLYLRPGTQIINQLGGLHKFISWNKPILTDSGGYQVFSLSDLNKISEDGVTFKSHLDGSTHLFTPESVVDIQRFLGSDIMMVLDECTTYPAGYEYAKKSIELTRKWAERCKIKFEKSENLYNHTQALFGIVQGSTYSDLREMSANDLIAFEFDGYAIGGLSVGEPVADMYAMTDICTDILPAEKPRYLMGVGTPENILESIERGVDMFDCVMPTRNGRNAMLFTSKGSLSIKNATFKDDSTPIDPDCRCYACRNFSRAYVRHLFQAREILALQLATIHNLYFYQWLVREARKAITQNRYAEWKLEQLKVLIKQKNVTTQHP